MFELISSTQQLFASFIDFDRNECDLDQSFGNKSRCSSPVRHVSSQADPDCGDHRGRSVDTRASIGLIGGFSSNTQGSLAAGISSALLATLFAYDGWMGVGNVAGEMKRPEKIYQKPSSLG